MVTDKLKRNVQFSLISILLSIWVITCSLISFLILIQSNLYRKYSQTNPAWNVVSMYSFVGINVCMCVVAAILLISYVMGSQLKYCFSVFEVLVAAAVFVAGIVISSIWAHETTKIVGKSSYVDGGIVVSIVYGFLASVTWALIMYRGCTLNILLQHAKEETTEREPAPVEKKKEKKESNHDVSIQPESQNDDLRIREKSNSLKKIEHLEEEINELKHSASTMV